MLKGRKKDLMEEKLIEDVKYKKSGFKIHKPINFLGFKTIIKDLKDLPNLYRYLILLAGISTTLLSFIDINHFISPKDNPSIWSITNQLNTSKPYLGSIPKGIDATLYCLSGLASFTGIVNVILISFGKMSCFFWGLINAIIASLFCFDYGYTGEAQLNLFIYLPSQLIGWFMWERSIIKAKNNNSKTSSSIDFKKSNTWLITGIALLASVILAIGWYFEIVWFHHLLTGQTYEYVNKPVPHYFDSLLNSISIVASALMFMQFKEQWILWLISNIINLAMFSGINTIGTGNVEINVNMIIELIFFIANCVVGLLVWSKIIDKDSGKIIKKNKKLIKKTI